MALIVQTALTSQTGPFTITETVMTASDTFVYTANTSQLLSLRNPTASSISVTIVGSAPISPYVPGTGTVFNTTAGKVIAVAAGANLKVNLDKISAYLAGGSTVGVTSGTGLVAYVIA